MREKSAQNFPLRRHLGGDTGNLLEPDSILWPSAGPGAAALQAARATLRADLADEAAENLARARREFLASGDTLGLAATELIEGNLEYFRGKEDKALNSYTAARDAYRQLGISRGVVKAWLGISQVKCARSDFGGARAACEEARDVLDEDADGPLRAEVFLHLAQVDASCFNLNEAMAAVQRALHFAGDDAQSLVRGNALYLLGEIESLRGSYKRSTEALQKALDHWARLGSQGSRHGRANVELELGLVECWWGNLDTALGHYRSALDDFVDIKEPYGEGLARLGLASVYCSRKEPDDAEAEAANAVEAFAKEGSVLGMLAARRVQARIALKRGRLTEAAALLDRAALHVEGRNHPEESAWLDMGRGDLALAQDDAAKARAHYENALDFFKRVGHAHGRALAILRLGRAHLKAGETQLASETFEKARAEYASIGSQRGEERARAALEGLRSEAARQAIPATDRGSPPKKSVALVMRGGGVKGIAFAGALEVLADYYDFHTFVGTSAGAITAVLLAAGLTPAKLRQALSQPGFPSRFLDAPWWRWLWNMLRHEGLHPGDELVAWLDEELYKATGRAIHRFEHLPRNAIVVAQDPDVGTTRFDKRDSLAESPAFAARCSASIPYLFIAPQRGNGRLYDGGLVHNFPVDIYLREAPTSDFIGLFLGTGRPPRRRKRPVAMDLLAIWLGQDEPQILDEHRDRIVVIDPSPVRTADFDVTDDGACQRL